MTNIALMFVAYITISGDLGSEIHPMSHCPTQEVADKIIEDMRASGQFTAIRLHCVPVAKPVDGREAGSSYWTP